MVLLLDASGHTDKVINARESAQASTVKLPTSTQIGIGSVSADRSDSIRRCDCGCFNVYNAKFL